MATKRIRNRNRKSKRRVRYLGGAQNDDTYNVNVPAVPANTTGRPNSPTGVHEMNGIQQPNTVPQNEGIQALIAALQAAQQAAQAAEQAAQVAAQQAAAAQEAAQAMMDLSKK
jgi:hypothetical protein